MSQQYPSQRAHLRAIAITAMRQRGLSPEFPQDALAQAASALPNVGGATAGVRDLRSLLWCSIDNDDSRDLDQLSVAEPLAGGAVKVFVAIADVDAIAPRDTPIDRHAAINTTSIYTPAIIFSMLPERLSTDLTSLVADQDRAAVVIEFTLSADGEITGSDIYRAVVRNHAKLAYNSVGAWLAGAGPLPAPAAAVAGMDVQLKVQDQVAQLLSKRRHELGALDFDSLELRPEFDGDSHRSLCDPNFLMCTWNLQLNTNCL